MLGCVSREGERTPLPWLFLACGLEFWRPQHRCVGRWASVGLTRPLAPLAHLHPQARCGSGQRQVGGSHGAWGARKPIGPFPPCDLTPSQQPLRLSPGSLHTVVLSLEMGGKRDTKQPVGSESGQAPSCAEPRALGVYCHRAPLSSAMDTFPSCLAPLPGFLGQQPGMRVLPGPTPDLAFQVWGSTFTFLPVPELPCRGVTAQVRGDAAGRGASEGD